MTSVNSEVPPLQNQIHLQTSNPTSEALDPDSVYKNEPSIMDTTHNHFSEEVNNSTDNLPGSLSMNVSNDNNANLEANTSGINRNLFSEMALENNSNIPNDLEYLVSSSEETKEISSKTSFDSPPLTPNRNGDILFESTDDDETEIFAISCHPGESFGLVLGMNEIIDASEGEIRKVYVKKVSTNGAINRAMNESNNIRLGDEILAINGTYVKNLSRTECLNLLIDLPNEITLLLLRNKLPWTTGPRCSFYLNLVDKDPESILSPAPKLFTNEGKKIPDGYKLLEVSLYREDSDLLGISIVPSYGNTRHYYQIKELEPEGICSKSKLLNKGDCLVSCNGNSLHKIPFNQCLNILKSEGPSLTFEVFRKDDNQAVLESDETQSVDDDGSEVNNNNNNNNSHNDDNGTSTNSFTSEILISAEIKANKSIKPVLETSNQENLLDLSDISHRDSKTHPNTSSSPDITKSHLSSFECEVKNTVSQPLLDFLTGSPFIELTESISLHGLQKPIDPAESSLPSVVDEPCIQLTTEAVESNPKTDWSSEFNIVPTEPPFIKSIESVSLDRLQKPIDPAEPSLPSVVDEPCTQLTTEAVESNPKTDWSSEFNIVPIEPPFKESIESVSLDGLQKPIDPAEPSLPSVVDEPCTQLTSEAVESSPKTDWSSELNMSEQSPANNPFSLDGLEEFSNTIINDTNELNNNLNTAYPGSSNEDLISIDTDILSPIIPNPNLTFSNHADPWEAAGEAKSENLLSDFQISQSTNQKNALNEFIDTVELPEDGLDTLNGLQENIIQVARDEKCLSSQPFGTGDSKGLNLVPSGNVSLDSDLVEEERTSPVSYDDSLSGSTGIQTADEEGDIPLSSRNSDNDLIDEMPALSPDSGRADSPGAYKTNSYYQEKFNKKEIISKLPPPRISDDHEKLTDDETTVYHTISDTSRENKGSEKHGSFDSSDSCGTSVGSFESCTETGELDPFSTNSKHLNKNKDSIPNLTRSLPRNAYSNFQQYKTSMFKSPNEDFSTLRLSHAKKDPNYDKSDYLNKFSANIFGNYKRERDQVRSEDKPFQVEVLKGIIGLGMTLKVDDQGFVKVTHIQNNSPIGRNGIIKVGDYILSINNTDIVGESYSRVQQILRLLPRGLIKVVASAVPLSDWKKYTEDAEKPSIENSGSSHVTVSLTSPIKMSDSFSLNSSGRGLKSTTERKPSLSFSSALNVFSKDQYTDSSKPPAPSVPSSLQKNGKTETFVKSSAFLNNNSKQSPPLDKKQKYNSYEHSPLSSPEIVLNQVRMFESFQNNNLSPEVKEPVISSKQKLVEMFEPGNQKRLPEKDRKEALPDILQDHTNTVKKQFCQEVKNGNAKSIAKTYNAVNKTKSLEKRNCIEDVIVPVKYNKFSALPKSTAPRILDSFSIWDSMDSIAMENQNKGSQIRKKTVSQVSSAPRDAVKEEVIIPKIKTSVQSLVNKFNFPQDSQKSNFSKYDPGSSVSKGYKATNEKAANEPPKQAIMEETIEPIRKACITNMSKPLPISFSDIFDIDEVLIIERTEKKNAKPDLKMTLTGPYSAAVEVSEPLLKPEKKAEVKTMKRPVAPPRTSYILNSSQVPKKDITVSEVNFTEPEVSIGIARRLSQSAIPDCIDIMKVPEVVPTENAFTYLEETIVPQVRTNKLEAHIESPRSKQAKDISLIGSMDDDIDYKCALALPQKLESDRTEVNEDLIISCIRETLSMNARSRKMDNVEDVTVPIVKKTSPVKMNDQCQENLDSSSHLSCENLSKCSLNVAEKKAEIIVKDIMDAAQKVLCQTSVSGVKNPDRVICDITGHTPWNEETYLPTVISKDMTSKSDILKDNFQQVVEPELKAEMRQQKLSTQKRNLPLFENGKPKPLPRQSRQLSPGENNLGEKAKTVHRSLPSPRQKSDNLPSTLETNSESQDLAQLISPVSFHRSMSPSDASLNMSTDLKITNHPEVSSVESPLRQQESNQMEMKVKVSTSPVTEMKTESLVLNSVDKVKKPSSPVSLQESPISWTEHQQTEHKAPFIMKSSLSLSSAGKTEEESESTSTPENTSSLSSNDLKNETPNFFKDDMETISSTSMAHDEEKIENLLSPSDTDVSEVKQEIAIPSSPLKAKAPNIDLTDGLSMSKGISPERPVSPVTKPPEFKKETLTFSSPVKIVSSSPVFPKVSEISPVLTSPVRPVSLFKNVTENQSSSPSASSSSVYLETTQNDSAPTSPTSLSPRRFGNTNRKLPDIFQSSHKSMSSPIKIKTFPDVSSPSESISIEKTVSEQKAQKIREVSNAEVALSQSISLEPKIASELTDSKLKAHGVEMEVTAEKHGIQVREEVSKPEVAVSQFIGIKPTTTTDLSEKKVTTPTTAVVEEIAKPEVAVSQFIGIKPTTVSDLSTVKDKVELSKPDNESTPNIVSVKEQEQNIEIFAGIPSPKSEVAVSKFIGVKPTTATKLSEPVKSSAATDAPKSPEKKSPSNKVKAVSTTRPDIVASAEFGRQSLPRSISLQYGPSVGQNVKSGNEENLSSIQGEKTRIIGRRRTERPRPKSEMPCIFSKRKWCISTKSGQTNFAVPSEPETVDRVVQLGIIDEDDLGRLLTSANMALDKMLFSNNEEIHIAILEKEASEKIGIKLKKGEKQELVISLLEADGAAIKQKFIYIGDSLLLVNGKPAWNQTVMDVKVMLQTIETRIILVLSRHPMDDEEAANDCEYLDIVLQKGVTGIGFCLEGGVGYPLGDRPISVKRIFKGGPAEKGGQLMVGDEILKVNDKDFQNQRHFVAWNHLKFLPEGDVRLHICRRKSQAASTKAAKLQATNNDSVADTSA